MATPATPTNGFDKSKLQGYIQRCENIDSEIASETGKFMKTIQDLKSDRKDVLQEAKDEGIPTKPLKAVLKHRKLLRDLGKVKDGLEGDDADSFHAIMESLGDWAEEVAARAA